MAKVMPLKWVRREFKVPEPEDGEEVVGGPAPVAASQSLRVAKGPFSIIVLMPNPLANLTE